MIEARATVRVDDLSRRLGLAAAKIQERLVLSVAEWLRLVIRTSFEKEATAEGAPWAPLSPKYLARKKGPGILREGGALFEQATRAPVINGNVVTAGSTLPYAAVHQFGFDGDVSVRAMIRRVRSRDVFGKMLGKNNKIVRGKIARGIGNVSEHSRHMRMPARPYLPSAEFAEAEGQKIAAEFVDDVIAKAGDA